MDRCDYINDYQEKYECRRDGGEAINYDINDLLNERFNTPSSKVELATIKQQALNNLTPRELNTFRNYIVELSNEKGRDDRLQLRELSAGLYKHNNSNYSRVNEGYDNQYNNIEEYRTNITFKPQSGHIKLDPLGGFADGKYTLRNYDITPISKRENIYNLELEFKITKKQKVFGHKTNIDYNHTEHLEFQYDKYNHRLTIRNNGRFYNVPLSNNNQGHRNGKNNRHGGGHGSRGEMLHIKIGKIKMKVFFKAD